MASGTVPHMSPSEAEEQDQNEKERAPSTPKPKHFKDWPNEAGFEASIEQLEPIELTVSGFIPSMLAGTLYRTGPGHYKVQNTKAGEFSNSHWFDGFTHVHRFQLIATPKGSCKVLYNSRRQVDPLIENIRKTGRLGGITFGQKRDPCDTFFQKIKCVFEPSASTNAGLSNVGVTISANMPGVPSSLKSPVKGTSQFSSLTCLTDANRAKHIDPETLQPMGVTNQLVLHPDLKGPFSASHAGTDPITGDLYNYNLDLGRTPTYRIFRTSASTMKTEILATLSGVGINAAYIHSFFLSEDFVILCIWPSLLCAGGVRILWERNIADAMKFDPNVQTRWLVVDRKHGRGLVASFASPAIFSFHTVNAWQQDNGDEVDIMCDIIQYPNLDILHKFYYENMVSTGPGVEKFVGKVGTYQSFARYKLAGIPKNGTKSIPPEKVPAAELVLKIPSPAVGDLPTINPKFSTRKMRHVYSVVDRGLASFFDGISKVDLETREVRYWGQPKHTPGEPIFVADGTDEFEDSGYLLSVVLNGETGSSYLLCLNARDMTELGRAECTVAVGFGFHGHHYPALVKRLEGE